MEWKTNDLFGKMLAYFVNSMHKGRRGEIVNVGGSRSGKTYDTAYLLLYLADKYKISSAECNGKYYDVLNENGSGILVIDVYRNELRKVRKTYEDFLACINLIGVTGLATTSVQSDKPSIKFPNGNQINFYGLPEEGEVEGSKSHICYFNEALEIPAYSKIRNIIIRCGLLVIYDANPRETEHWLYDKEGTKNTLYTHTTYKDNKFLGVGVVNSIEELCPWDFKDYIQNDKGEWYWRVPEKERAENTENVKLKHSASKRDWLIYGEGARCAREGAAFDVQFVRGDGEGMIDRVVWGLDFGYKVHETALCRCEFVGGKVYAKLLIYKPYDKVEDLYADLEYELNKEEEWYKSIGGNTDAMYIVCESQDNFEGTHFVEMIKQQAEWKGHYNWDFGKVKKKPRYKLDLISNINRFGLLVEDDPRARLEFLNYVFEERNGSLTSELHGTKGVNDHDHMIDAVLYACWLMLKRCPTFLNE